MFCKNCGEPVDSMAIFCSRCGTAQQPADPAMEQAAQAVLTRSIVGLALAHFCVPFAGFIISNQAKKLHDAYLGRGGVNTGKVKLARILANIGFPLGIVNTVLILGYFTLLIFYYFVVFFGMFGLAAVGSL